MKVIVISAVNLRKGGTLTILRQCLSYLSSVAIENSWKIIALVHKQELADFPNVEYIELPWSIEGWGKRLWCEYVTMNKISKEITKREGEIDLWLSLHDTTPRVVCKRQATYCHTAFPFFKWKFRDFRFDKKIPIFGMLTKFIYKINVKSNDFIVVQGEWLRKGFSKMFGVDYNCFIVAPPSKDFEIPQYEKLDSKGLFTFFYASTADVHKDFETLCRASKLLEERIGKNKFQTILTVSGNETNYAQKYATYLKDNWGNVDSIKFYGFMDKPTLFAHYDLADCLVQTSRVEACPLPISEFMIYKKPMILVDLPYAHDISQGSPKTAFIPLSDEKKLFELMYSAYINEYKGFYSIKKNPIASPYANNWGELFTLLLKS